MFDEPDLARPRCGHPGWQQCQRPVRLPNHQVFDTSVALDANNHDEFTASRMKRISNPLLARQTPGSMTLLRPAAGKSHAAAALGRALIENGYRVLFTRTTDLVQRLQAARQALQLEAAIAKLDRYDLLILDDLSYVHKDHAETSVLFELIGARYERRSLLITANQPFGDWDKVFPDHAMMIAAIDRLVHHAIIFEMNVESYRRRGALDRKSQTPTALPRTPRARLMLIHAASDNQTRQSRILKRQTKLLPATINRGNHAYQAWLQSSS